MKKEMIKENERIIGTVLYQGVKNKK